MSGAAEKGSTGTTKTPADFLKSIRGRPVVVKLNSGVDYRGQSLTPISITTHLFMVISLCLIFLVLVIKIASFFSSDSVGHMMLFLEYFLSLVLG